MTSDNSINSPPATPSPLEEKHQRARTHTVSIGDAKKTEAFESQRRSWLAPFFGSNVPEPSKAEALHPCVQLSRDVHRCLDTNRNDFDFCQSKVARFETCLMNYNKGLCAMQLLNSIKASYEEGLYILDGVLCNGGSSLCLSTSAHSLRVYDVRSAAFQFDICAHTAVITDVTSTPSQPNLLYSSQEDTGVMVTDLRQGKPVHFLTEMCSSGARCCSVAVSQSGEKLALAADGDVHFVDTRTWCSFTSLPELHNDEITRLRFTDDRTLCTASEDQLVNLVDVRPAVSEDDMILSVINCEEVVTKMTCFPEKGVVTLIGSCENAFIVPLDLVSNETKIRRENFQTYQVDFVLLGDTLTLVSGLKDDDGVVGPLVTTEFASCTVPSAAAAAGVSGEGISTQRVAFTTQRVSTLPFVHKELTRVALGFGNRLVTGGEDGVVAYWQKGASGGASGTPGACHDTASTGESNSSSARNAAQMKARVKTSTLEATGRKTHGPY